MDNVGLNARVPFEDEFATCGTRCSPFLTWVFPHAGDEYNKYFSLRGVPEAEIAEWKAAFTHFCRKLTWKYSLPLLLKSPPHTSRIRLLLTMFPEARFVHIHRNPYVVFQSTRRQTQVSLRTMGLQRLDAEHIDAMVIGRYKIMYDAFFEDCALIPDGRFHEVCFEELEKDPLGQVKGIYDQLSLPGFDAMRSSLRRYVDSSADYRKRTYTDLSSPLREEIGRVWQRSCQLSGYAT